jgi:hypothetical protein
MRIPLNSDHTIRFEVIDDENDPPQHDDEGERNHRRGGAPTVRHPYDSDGCN